MAAIWDLGAKSLYAFNKQEYSLGARPRHFVDHEVTARTDVRVYDAGLSGEFSQGMVYLAEAPYVHLYVRLPNTCGTVETWAYQVRRKTQAVILTYSVPVPEARIAEDVKAVLFRIEQHPFPLGVNVLGAENPLTFYDQEHMWSDQALAHEEGFRVAETVWTRLADEDKDRVRKFARDHSVPANVSRNKSFARQVSALIASPSLAEGLALSSSPALGEEDLPLLGSMSPIPHGTVSTADFDPPALEAAAASPKRTKRFVPFDNLPEAVDILSSSNIDTEKIRYICRLIQVKLPPDTPELIRSKISPWKQKATEYMIGWEEEWGRVNVPALYAFLTFGETFTRLEANRRVWHSVYHIGNWKSCPEVLESKYGKSLASFLIALSLTPNK